MVAVHSINMWICMIGPSFAAGLTSHLDAFSVMLPGLWCQALSPLLLAYYPSIGSAIVWVAFLSIGEVIWSPRQSAWVANLAPDGREGVFLALLSLKSLVTALPSTALNGWLNAAFQPNCPECRDPTGHFCWLPRALNESVAVCATGHSKFDTACIGDGYGSELHHRLGSGEGMFHGLNCPSTCVQCPGWEGHADLMWLIVLLSSVTSPVLVHLSLKFLRGPGD